MNTRRSFFNQPWGQKIRDFCLYLADIFEMFLRWLFGRGFFKGALIIFGILTLIFFATVIAFAIRSSGLADLLQEFYYFFFHFAR